MKVRALQAGFFGGRRRAGDVFDVPEGTKGKWFAPVADSKAAAAAPAKPAKQEPQALSQRGKNQPQSMTDVLGKKEDEADNLV